MADVKDRIKGISEFFKGMQVDESEGEQIIYVMVEFPSKWIIDEDIPNKFDVSVGQDGNLYYFCAGLEQGFDVIFDAIEYNISKMKTAQERANLFRAKTQELQELFENEDISIESLRTLDFTYKGKKKKSMMQPKSFDDTSSETHINKEEDA